MDRFDPRWADARGSDRSADRDWGSQTSGLPKCRLANARPDPVFRYRSKCPAVVASANSSATTTDHGLWCTVTPEGPELCHTSRRVTSLVRPT